MQRRLKKFDPSLFIGLVFIYYVVTFNAGDFVAHLEYNVTWKYPNPPTRRFIKSLGVYAETYESLGGNEPVYGHSDIVPNRKPGDPLFTKRKIPDKRGRRIFDCFFYSGEAAMLYIRLWRFYDYVDKFLITVLPISYTNQPRNYSIWPFEEEIRQFKDKIVFLDELPVTDYSIDSSKAWSFENSIRRFHIQYIKKHFKPKKGDLIIATDLDEQLTREGMDWVIEHFTSSVNLYPLMPHLQPGYLFKQGNTIGITVHEYDDNMPDLLEIRRKVHRHGRYTGQILATHCSWCFTHLENFTRKKDSYSHQEKNIWPQNDDSFTFRYHWCRFWDANERSFVLKPTMANTGTTMEDLMPDHPKLKYLVTPGFMLDINKTIWEYEDLETMCQRPFPSRQEWERRARAKGIYIIRHPVEVLPFPNITHLKPIIKL